MNLEDVLKLGFSKFSRLENVGKNTVRELSTFLDKTVCIKQEYKELYCEGL